LLIAVPLAASIGVIVRFAVKQYLENSAHTKSEPAPAAAEVVASPRKSWLKGVKVIGV
jgi:hypothetical protein